MIKRDKYINKINKVLSLKKIVFLVGSRQVGKTTLMKFFQKLYNGIYINFDEMGIVDLNFKTLEEFLDYINFYFGIDLTKQEWIFLDEISRIKNFNIILKAFKDKFKEKNIICASSGNYDFVNTTIEGLAGRAIKIDIYPLSFEEFLIFKNKNLNISQINENIFNLLVPYIKEYITFGGYPEVVITPNKKDKYLILKSIIDGIFEKDLTYFITKSEIPDITKLINYFSENIGNPISIENIANILGIKTKRLKFLIDLLEKSYIIKFLPPFWTEKKYEYSKKNKLYILDFGIINYFKNNLYNNQLIFSGKNIETFVFLNLLFNLNFEEKIFFYRKINGTEIDFIIKNQKGLIPVETKLSNKDNIPKVFNFFYQKYKKNIHFFVKTTKYLYFERKIGNITIYGIPFWYIHKIFN